MVSEPTARVKLVQSEVSLGMLVQDMQSQAYHMFRIPLAVPLQCLDSSTGAALHACARETLSIPLWEFTQQMFPNNFMVAVMDRASENNSSLGPFALALVARFPCDAHICSTSTERACVE